MTFLPQPHPERIYRVSIEGERLIYGDALSVGLKIIEKDSRGLKIVPHACVVFALGDGDNLERNTFCVPLDAARALAARLVEFADAGEKMNNG